MASYVNPATSSPYLSDTYETALAVLANGLSNDVIVNIVLGAPGTGKTTLIEYFLKNIPQVCAFSQITNAIRSDRELYQLTLEGFGLEANRSEIEEIGQQLRDFLKDAYAKQNQPSLLLIDDADTMSIEAFKGISSMADENNDTHPFVQIVLAGTESLLDLLKAPELERLSKKVGTLCFLTPLTVKETKGYIRHRLKATDALNKNLFDDQVCSAIYRSSKGVPKAINSLCDDALVRATAQKMPQFDTDAAHNVAEQGWQQGTHEYETPPHRRVGKAAFLLGGLLAGAIVTMFFAQDKSNTRVEKSPSVRSDVSAKNFVREENLTGREPNRQISAAIALEYETFQSRLPPNNSPETLQRNRTTAAIVSEGKAYDSAQSKEIQNNAARVETIGREQQYAMPESDISTEHQKIEMLIALAEEQMAASKFSLPQNDNAFETYSRILAASPNEERALVGLKNIANRYLELALIQRDNGNLRQSGLLITRGLRIDARHARLLSLKEQVTSELESQSNESNLRAATERIRQQIPPPKIAQRQHTDPLDKSQEPSAVGEQSQAAIDKEQEPPLPKSQLENALEKQDFTMALRFAERILANNPSGGNDSNWRETLLAAIDAKQVIRNQIKDLLHQAELQFTAQQISRPAGENAYQSYQQVLEIDPDNQSAARGIERISQYYDTLARTKLAEGDREKALTIVSEGLETFPKHAGLLSIRESFEDRQDSISTKSDEAAFFEKPPEETKPKRKFRTSISF